MRRNIENENDGDDGDPLWIPRDLLRIPFVGVEVSPEEIAEEPMSRKVTLSVRARRSLCKAFWSATVTGVVGVNVTVLGGFGTTALGAGGGLTTGVDFFLGAVGSSMIVGSACSASQGSSGDGSKLSLAASAGWSRVLFETLSVNPSRLRIA